MRRSIRFLALSVALSIHLPSTAARMQPADETSRRKAGDLLARFIEDVKALSLPENRIWLLTRAFDPAWRGNEPLARALVEEAVKDFQQMIGELDDDDSGYRQALETIFQLRQEMLASIAKHEAQLAIEFLNATRQPELVQSDPHYRHADFESELQTRLAVETVSKNPAEALRVAEQALERSFSSSLPNLLANLREKDAAGAARLARQVVARLRPGDTSKDSAANATAFYLIGEAMRMAQHAGPVGIRANAQAPLLDEATLGELKAAIFRDGVEVLSSAPVYTTTSLLTQLTPIMREFEEYVQVRAPGLRGRLVDYLVTKDTQAQLWQGYLNLEQRSVDQLLQALPHAPSEVQGRFYQHAAWRVFNQGDVVRARALVEEKISDPVSRREMLASFNEQLLWRAADRGKIEEARQLASQVSPVERRVGILAQLASRVLQSGNKRLALDVLDEARAATTGRPAGYYGLVTQVELAEAYARVEPGRGFEIVEAAVAILNDAIAAARQLDGFDVNYFRRGELLLFRGGQLVHAVSRLSNALGALGKTDFDRAMAAADLFQLNEARVAARLPVLEGALSDSEQPEPSPVSFGVSMRGYVILKGSFRARH